MERPHAYQFYLALTNYLMMEFAILELQLDCNGIAYIFESSTEQSAQFLRVHEKGAEGIGWGWTVLLLKTAAELFS